MLDTLTIRNCFAHTDTTIEFKDGLTAITGPNGTGKSMILEMVRFALFGASALRTNTEDYKGAQVSLIFSVRGIAYSVLRSTSVAKLYREGDLIASGTRPVNAKVIETFGYGLDVFDVANVANQGMIEALSSMRPADRKRLVDSTVGLNVIDDLAAWCADEAASRSKEAATVRGMMVQPVAPVQPEGYRPASELISERTRLNGLASEWRDLSRQINAVPLEYVEPWCAEPRTAAELQRVIDQRGSLKDQLSKTLKAISENPKPTFSEAELDDAESELEQAEAHRAAIRFTEEYPEPPISEADIATDLKNWKLYDDFRIWEELNLAGGHTCPKCEHTWPINAEKMARHRAEPVTIPSYTVSTLNRWRRILTEREARPVESVSAKILTRLHGMTMTITSMLISRAELTQRRKQLGNEVVHQHLTDRAAELTEELKALPSVNPLDVRLAYDKAHRQWVAMCEARATLPALCARLAELEGVSEQADALATLLTECQVFDRMATAYGVAFVAYASALTRVEALDAERQQYSAARVALAEIKSRVKTYLVPSLSRVASGLLSKMTGGALSSVEVSEDFDVRVDGVSMDGLSGAGKAAANLALRIGLGQVLTNRVFSCFCADEIDAAMDESRAEALAACLQNLTGSVSQILLVSHKRPEADHYIQL